MKKHFKKTDEIEVFLDSDNIINYTYLIKINMTYERALQEFELCKEICDGKKIYIIVDISKCQSISKRARDVFSNEFAQMTSALALIVNSPVSRVIANFFLGINKPPFPLKLFSSKKDGILWLKQQKEKLS